ncbi:MAG: APC family permease [Erythrobacter sp.]|nr:APC family permease [Erythrobacter sp.]
MQPAEPIPVRDGGLPQRKRSLNRALNLPLLTLYGLGVTLGAGIYVLVGETASEAGIYAPLAFLCAAIVVGVTALSYAELATRFPVSAGEAAYVDAGFGIKWLTLLVGLLVAASGIVSASAVAIGAASYLSEFVGLSVSVLTILTVVAMSLLAIWGIAQSVTVAAIITLVEIIGLAIVIGWSGLGSGEPQVPVSAIFAPREFAHWIGIGSATLLAFFAFIGFEDMANVAEEVKDPTRTFPRAVILTLAITTVLYVATTVAVVTTVPMERLAGSAAPLSLVFQSAPPALRDGFSAIAVIATVNGILIQIIMASRVIFGLADRGFLPRPLAHIAARTRTPAAATGLVMAIVIVLSQAFPIKALAESTSQIVLVTFALVNLALVRMKWRNDVPTSAYFKVPAILPITGSVLSLALLLAATVWL